MKTDWRVVAILLLVFTAGFLLRVYPALTNDFPLKYDSYYHARVAELVKTQGFVAEEPWVYGGRPLSYPPVYHLILAILSQIIGASTLDVARLLLPIISSLSVASGFLLVRRFRDEKTALLTAFFLAANAILISSAYDSPEVINLLLSLVLFLFIVKQQYLKSSLLAGAMFLLNTFSASAISGLIIIYLLANKKGKGIPTFLIFPLVVFFGWLVLRPDILSCLENTFGPLFVGKTINFWTDHYTPIVVGGLLFVASLFNAKKADKYSWFWLLWVLYFGILFLSHYVTDIFHPWRHLAYLGFGFSFLLPDLLSGDRKLFKLLKVLFILVFFATTLQIYNGSLAPALQSHERSAIYWASDLKSSTGEKPVFLSSYVTCSNLMTLTNQTCVLDLNFECIVNKTAWFDYENFMWNSDPAKAKAFFNKYSGKPITDAIFGSQDWGGEMLDGFNVNRIYTSWACYPNNSYCTKGTSIYEFLK